MPRIRDLGITSIPMARRLSEKDGGADGTDQTCTDNTTCIETQPPICTQDTECINTLACGEDTLCLDTQPVTCPEASCIPNVSIAGGRKQAGAFGPEAVMQLKQQLHDQLGI